MARTTLKQRSFYRPLLLPLLTLIRTKEARGYNDVVSHLRYAKPDDITELRLSEVRAWQRKLDPTTEKGEAVGFYQFTKETIDQIVEGSDIRWEDRFSPDVQDHMAIHLLLTRTSVKKAIEGKVEVDRIVDQVARIWASFPVSKKQRGAKRVVPAGASYYAGVGSNRAYVRLSSVRKAVQASLGAIYAQGKAGSSPRIVSGSLSRPSRAAAQRPAAVRTPAPKTTVKVTKSTVKAYQRWLNAMGARPKLRVDGLVGRKTRKAATDLGRDLTKDLSALQKGGNLPRFTTDKYGTVRSWLRAQPNGRRIVEAYQTILNTSRSASRQIEVDGLFGPATFRAAQELGRPILADLKNLGMGRNVQP